MRNIAIYGNRYQDGYFGLLREFFAALEKRDFRVSVAEDFACYLSENGIDLSGSMNTAACLPEDTECVISIGGDGTFLGAAEWVGDREIPILGINTGHLGFLASYSLEETEELVDVVAGDKGVVEKRALLEIRCEAMPEGFW